MDDEEPKAGTQDKIMAAVGLLVGAVLIVISIDLLRPPRVKVEGDDDGA